MTPETAAAVRRAVAALDAQGITVEPCRPAVLDRVGDLWQAFFCEMGDLLLRPSLGAHARELPILQAYFAARPGRPEASAARIAQAWIDRDVARAELLADMERRRVLVCPVASVPAFRHGERSWDVGSGRVVGYLDAMLYTQWFNVLGNPVVGGPGRDARPRGCRSACRWWGAPSRRCACLQVAAAIERGCGGFVAPPVAR